MKLSEHIGLLCLLAYTSFCKLESASLDGTAGVSIYEAASYGFANGDFARGFVRLNGGFTVPAASTVSLNLLTPVAGTIGLNTSGQITLEGDLSLASNATLITGGKIDGQGYTVFLNGDFTIPAGQSLECASNTVIDGMGHTLTLAPGNPGGQIFINGISGTTVTLRNMTLIGLDDYTGGNRSIKFSTVANQKLVLEDVSVFLGGNYTFVGGKLDIKGFVSLHGWNTFEYQANQACTILQNSTFFIDMHTTFKYNTSDNSNIHIVMIDRTSRLFLNGCTLDVSRPASLFLTKGHLIVDHDTEFFGNGSSQESESISFGNGLASQDLNVDIMPGANIDLNESFLTYNNQN